MPHAASSNPPNSPRRPRNTVLRPATPADYDLPRDACSYGYFLLEPNHWEPAARTFALTLALEHGGATITISQARVGMPLVARADRALTRAEAAAARAMSTRALRLDESEQDLATFHDADPRWRFSGRGRLMRSPSLFEDVVKTITSCNIQWPGTIDMNAALCQRLGQRSPSGRWAFPTPDRLARARPASLRTRCRVGYRDQRIVDLARLFTSGHIDQRWLEDPATADDEARRYLLDLPGVGPYAANNILQLLGRYGHLPLDTESVRHGRDVLGFTGDDRQVMRRVQQHYERFGTGDGGQAFRSYWLDLWMHYELARGPAHTWEKRTTGRSFTAARLRSPAKPTPRRRAAAPQRKRPAARTTP